MKVIFVNTANETLYKSGYVRVPSVGDMVKLDDGFPRRVTEVLNPLKTKKSGSNKGVIFQDDVIVKLQI